jgi:hypothetical protein
MTTGLSWLEGLVLSDAFLFKLAEGAAAVACTLEEVFFLVLAGAEGVDVALDGDVTDVDAFL